MMPSRPKAPSIPRIPHQGWRLPWLQMAESQHRLERYKSGLQGVQMVSTNDYARQLLISNAIADRPNPHLGSRT